MVSTWSIIIHSHKSLKWGGKCDCCWFYRTLQKAVCQRKSYSNFSSTGGPNIFSGKWASIERSIIVITLLINFFLTLIFGRKSFLMLMGVNFWWNINVAFKNARTIKIPTNKVKNASTNISQMELTSTRRRLNRSKTNLPTQPVASTTKNTKSKSILQKKKII